MSIFDTLKPGPANPTQPAAVLNTTPHAETFSFQALPESVAQLQALPEAALFSPFQTAALTVCALCAYGAVPNIGIEMLNFLKGPQPLTPYELQFLRDRFYDKKYVPFSYFSGASVDNDYTPSVPFTVTVTSTHLSFQQEDYAMLYLTSAGADSPRQVKLRRKGNQWFLWEQFLLGGIRIPKSQNLWA